MAWLVIHDHGEADQGSEESAVGRGQWGGETRRQGGDANPPDLQSLPLRARLYDDDGTLCYTVAYDTEAMDDDEAWGGMYQCFRWGMYYAGCTELRIHGESVYA